LNDDGALFDARFDDGGPFRDTPEAGGISLESALRDFGPAAIDDLIPRVRALARQLDAAHRGGAVHGALHPGKVIVYDDSTSLIKGTRSIHPYLAPEVEDGDAPSAASDQYALAAITYEWLFGRPIDGPARRAIDVKAMPGVDRLALSKAFSRALSPEPDDRFASCSEFCDALAAAASPELPLLALDTNDHDPVAAINVDDVKIVAEETNLTAAQPDLDAIDSGVPFAPEPVASWNPPQTASSHEPARFGGVALILAAIVGAVFGFAAGYMARPRALQTQQQQTFATAPGTENEVAAKPAATKAPEAPAAQALAAPKALPAPQAPQAPQAPEKVGRLLVRSTPSGATVSVDGVEKGVTPLALGEVEFGARTITIARRGYTPESRRVVITAGRPSRSVDVRLFAAAQPVSPKPRANERAARPSTPATVRQAQGRPEQSRGATIGKPTAATGGLNIDSRPTGASVAINGKASGKTPLRIDDLPPGEYRVLMSMPGYRNFATTVRVVAGERARAAASLTAQEQQ